MSEIKTQENKLSLNKPGRLELKKTVETGQVRQSFSHGRTKAVTVEVKRKRTFERGTGGGMQEVKAKADGMTAGDDAVLVNGGFGVAGIVLIVIGLYHWQGGWDLSFDEEQALGAAAEEVGFPAGHASAQLGWRGLRSRPTWRILLYSNEKVPEKRGLVLVDGVNGEIIDRFVEDNPEDWSDYDV